MAYCTSCGGEISQGGSYCQHCGVKDYRRTGVLTHGPLRPTDGETTDVSASFEVQPNNLFNKAFVKLIGKKLLGSPRETLQNDLSDLANAEEGS